MPDYKNNFVISSSKKKDSNVSSVLKEYHERYKEPEPADITVLSKATGLSESYIKGVLRLSIKGYSEHGKSPRVWVAKKKDVVYMDEVTEDPKEKLEYLEEKPPILSKSDLAIREYDKLIDAGERLNLTALAKKLKMARSTVTRALEKARPEYKKYLGKAKK